jgi:hypothetical protein
MFTKHNRFYADWRDRRGVRKRKAFLTAADATRFEMEQQAKAHPKKQDTERASKRSSVPMVQRGESKSAETKSEGRTTATRHSDSSKLRAGSKPKTSRKPTPKPSSPVGTTSRRARATPEPVH